MSAWGAEREMVGDMRARSTGPGPKAGVSRWGDSSPCPLCLSFPRENRPPSRVDVKQGSSHPGPSLDQSRPASRCGCPVHLALPGWLPSHPPQAEGGKVKQAASADARLFRSAPRPPSPAGLQLLCYCGCESGRCVPAPVLPRWESSCAPAPGPQEPWLQAALPPLCRSPSA